MNQEKFAEEIYKIGFKNGSIETKNKILKTINRDMSFFTTKNETYNILTKIDKMKLPKARPPKV